MKLSLIVVLLALLAVVNSQQCTHTAMQATAAKLSSYLANFTDPNYSPTNFDTQIETIINEATPCFSLMESFANFQDVAVSRVTDDCVYDQTGVDAAKWKADACCNPELLASQCCVAKTVNETEPRVTSFKAALTSSCGYPNSAKPLVDEFFSSFKKRIDRCDSIFKASQGLINSQEKRMIGCFGIYQKPPKCKSDSDCFGGTCSPKTKKCVFTGPEDPNPVLECMFAQVPPITIRNMRQKLGFKASTPIGDVKTAFKAATIGQECQDINGNTLPGNSSTCLATKQCNLPLNGTSCPTQPQCAFCDQRGICDFVLTELKTNASCTSSGLCLGGGAAPGPGLIWDKATCENGTFKYCTVYDKCNEDNGCNATACAAVGECVGYPFLGNSCVFPFDYDNSTQSITCRTGRTYYDEGCEDLSAAYNTSAKCTTAGGVWYKLPTTQAECEQYKGCYDAETKIFTPLPQAECTKCKLTYQSRYTWNAGVWTTSVFIQDQKWVVPAQVPVNRYINAINQNRLQAIITQFLSFQAAPFQQTYMQCAFNPLVDLFKSIACDCGTSKGPNGTCYPTVAPVAVGTSRVYSGLSGVFKEPSVSVIVPNNTVDSTKDVDGIVVSRVANKDIHMATDISNYYDMFNIHFLNQANAITGVAVSSGFAVSRTSNAALTAPVTLCIQRDKKVTVGAAYTDAAFATKDASGALVKTSVQLIGTDFSNQMCGYVQTTNTYYAAFFSTNAATSSTPTKSPNTGSAATVFVACLAIVFSVLGYMF